MVALHFFDHVVVNPAVGAAGRAAPAGQDLALALLALGAEVTWYARSNAHLGVTPALVQVRVLRQGAPSTRSRAGPGARVTAGKEWWVSARWGLGLALHATAARTPFPADGAGTVATWALGLSATATYN